MKKIKHNKIKNTGLLFEVLIRNFSVDALNGKTTNTSQKIIQKYFNSNTELGKELSLYNMLSESKISNNDKANYIIESALQLHKELNLNKLNKEKYNLIKEISENYNLNNFFDIKLNNYKLLASCYKLFEFKLGNMPPVDLIKSRFHILENITNTKTQVTTNTSTNDNLKFFLEQDNDTKILAYREMISDFNSNYVSKLNEDQNQLLSLYIKINPNENTFRETINSKIFNILKEIEQKKLLIKDKVLLIKLNEISKSLDKIKNNKILNEDHIITIMRFYDLLESLRKI